MPRFPSRQGLGAQAPRALQAGVGFCFFKYHGPGERELLPEHQRGEACRGSELYRCLRLPQAPGQCWQQRAGVRHGW